MTSSDVSTSNVEDTAVTADEEEPIILWMSGNEEETSDFVQWWPY